ncbi:MAG: STAS/SEC14 domain-containing protein [Thalassobaculum sp.]|uniref:STAS/SEC14 domain-containing protein n=1 Tax=Thalassobaculum sp. TaxID=2022740 RepID=UPI0032ECB8B6
MLTLEQGADGIVTVRASETLTRSDYDRFVPEFEQLAKTLGPVRLLLDLENFRGWDLPGLWEEFKFDVSHQDDLGRVAVVGEPGWQEWATRLSKPFFKAESRFFDRTRMAEARAWLAGT